MPRSAKRAMQAGSAGVGAIEAALAGGAGRASAAMSRTADRKPNRVKFMQHNASQKTLRQRLRCFRSLLVSC
jgi:hypothetical protein